jgi:hypothetical protein
MNEDIYIIGQKAFDFWGISFPPEAINAICAPLANKAYIENESREEHGSRIIIHNPKIAKREITVEMHLSAKDEVDFDTKYERLMLMFEIGNFPIIYKDVEYKFIFQSCSQFSRVGNIAKFVLKLVEPNPKDREV